MRGYSHLSDDEREQIGLLKVLGHSIGAIARAVFRLSIGGDAALSPADN
ncbi:MAG TPA: helix-turn-helix domain-containing protein [Casimicrobiaceae bacterium]|nr:helix-turn-helix domain-containing protein [Casimicrobiaceae bacterium]